MQGVEKDLLRDVECYTCGEDPSPLAMLRAPRLDDWQVMIRRRGKEFVLVVAGTVAKRHDDIPEGGLVGTGAVVWFDRHLRFVRTHKRLWVLGEPGGDEGFNLPEGS